MLITVQLSTRILSAAAAEDNVTDGDAAGQLSPGPDSPSIADSESSADPQTQETDAEDSDSQPSQPDSEDSTIGPSTQDHRVHCPCNQPNGRACRWHADTLGKVVRHMRAKHKHCAPASWPMEFINDNNL